MAMGSAGPALRGSAASAATAQHGGGRSIPVMVRRWQDDSGKKATLEGDGRTFECNGPRYSGRSGQIVTQRFCRGLSLSLDSFRTVLAVKGSLRRAYRRALDSSGPF